MNEIQQELRELRDYASDGEFDDRYIDDGVDKVRRHARDAGAAAWGGVARAARRLRAAARRGRAFRA
jgi:hypothetical protein